MEDSSEKIKKEKRIFCFSHRTYVVYKLLLANEEFTQILITFYNIVIEKGIILERWRNMIDTMIEKGKRPYIDKLRIIELIEGDLQLIIRIYVGLRNDRNIQKNKNISYFNFGSRKNYSIKSALLEKRLIYDSSKYNNEITIHLLSDLEACYDRQIPSIGGMVEEAVGVDRRAIMLITKIIETMRHHISIGFRISKASYGGPHEKLVGT